MIENRLYWNPLKRSIGPSYARHAPTLRSGFVRKMYDTFDALWGRVAPETMGIMDYLTLGVGVLFRKMAGFLRKAHQEGKILVFLRPISYLLELIFILARASVALATFLVSVVLTVVVSVVFLPFVQLIASRLSAKDRALVLQVRDSGGRTLAQFLESGGGLTINDLTAWAPDIEQDYERERLNNLRYSESDTPFSFIVRGASDFTKLGSDKIGTRGVALLAISKKHRNNETNFVLPVEACRDHMNRRELRMDSNKTYQTGENACWAAFWRLGIGEIYKYAESQPQPPSIPSSTIDRG